MNPIDQKKITKNLTRIKKSIQKDAATITDRLVEEGAIPAAARSEIRGVRPSLPHLQCGVLVNLLLRSGPEAYGKFVKVLEERGYSTLVATLENTCRNDDEVQSTENEREGTFIIPTPRIPDRLSNERRSYTIAGTSASNSGTQPNGVEKLGRMMTFVLTTFDERNNTTKQDFRQRLVEESKGNEVYKTLRRKSFKIANKTAVQ